MLHEHTCNITDLVTNHVPLHLPVIEHKVQVFVALIFQ